MDFSWTEEQLALKQKAIEFAERELNDDLVLRNRDGVWSQTAWERCAEYGLLGLTVPEQYGGNATDIMTSILILEGIGYGCKESGLPFAINSQLWSVVRVLVQFGTEEQKHKYLPDIVAGKKHGAFGITEADGGSDSFSMSTTARKVDGGYILNGEKSYVTIAPLADFAIVFASTNPDQGSWGATGFIVDRGETKQNGFNTTPVVEKMGLRTTPFSSLVFEDCFVPDDQRLGPEGGAVTIFTNAMEAERSYIFASQLGRMERQLEESIAYTRKRKAFGQSVSKFQSVSNRIVEMKMRLETARLLLFKVAWLEQQGKPLLMEAAMSKLYLSEMFVQSSLDAIRNHGAVGIATEHEVERDLRDSIGGLIYSGTSDIQRNIIARLLGL